MRQVVLVTLLASIAACATPGKDTAIGAGVGATSTSSSRSSNRFPTRGVPKAASF